MSEQGSDHKPSLDVDAEKERLEKLEHDIQATKKKAEKDLTPGHGQREFVDDYPGDPDDDVAGTDSA